MQAPADPRPSSSAAGWTEAYADASKLLSRSLDPVDVLRAFMRVAGPAFTQARLGMIDPATPTRARIVAETEAGAVRAADYPDRFSDYPGWDTLAEREALIIPDMVAEPSLFPDQRDRLRARRIIGLALFPFVYDTDLLGVLITSSSAPVSIDNDRMAAVRALADQYARSLALRRLRGDLAAMEARSTRTTRQLDAVTRLALRSEAFTDSTSLYRFAVREMVQLLRADHGGVLVLEADAVAGTVVAEYPDSGALGSRLIMAGNEIFDMVLAQRGAPVIANHIASDTRLLPDTRDVFQKIGLRSIMFVPILLNNEIVASIGMDLFTDDREFDQDMADTAQVMAAQVSAALQNLQRAEQLSRQLSAVETMSALASSIYRLQDDEKSLFDSVGERLAATVDSDHAAFILIEPGDVMGRIVSEYPARGMVGSHLELASSFASEPLRQYQAGADGPVVLNDVQKNPRVPEQARALLAQSNTQNMLFVPFRVDGHLTGMAVFDRTGVSRPYTPETLAVAQTIGAELAVGLQNMRLVQEARRRARQLERIADFTRAAQASETVEDVLSDAIEAIRNIVPADRIGLLFFDEEQRELRLVARYQDDTAVVQLKGGPQVSVNGTYAGQVWSQKTPVTIADTQEGAQGRTRPDTGIRSMALFPFDGGAGLRGVLSVGSALPGSYGEADAAVLQQMVNQVASALESRAALAARQTTAAQESLVSALSERYQRATDVNDVLSATLRDLGQYLGARRGRIRLSMEPALVTERAAEADSGMELW